MCSMRRWFYGAAIALSVAPVAPALANEPVAAAVIATPAEATSPNAEPSLLARIQQQLSQAARKGNDAQDRAALAAFYAEPNRATIWVAPTGLTAHAIAAINEIRKAADWGLDAASFDVPDARASLSSPEMLAAAEIQLGTAVLKYARHARGGRIDVGLLGRNFDQRPPLLEPNAVLDAIAAAPAADAYLRGLHPKHPQFEKLRQALLAARAPATASAEQKSPGADIKIPAGPRLKPGQSHAHVALLRQRLGIAEGDGPAQLLDEPVAAALRQFQLSKGIEPDGSLGNATRSALNGAAKPANGADNTQRILVNMERWRWLPESLGEFHVWDNVPEYPDARREGQQGRPHREHHRRQAVDADADLLGRYEVCDLPSELGRA